MMKLIQPAFLLGVIFLLAIGGAVGENRFNVLTFADDPRVSNLDSFYIDLDNFGAINMLDITYLIDYLYKAGPEPVCSQAKGSRE